MQTAAFPSLTNVFFPFTRMSMFLSVHVLTHEGIAVILCLRRRVSKGDQSCEAKPALGIFRDVITTVA